MIKIHKKRHLLKAFTYRLISSLASFGLAFALTREINISLIFMGLDFIIKIAIYYFHERLWYTKSKYGVSCTPLQVSSRAVGTVDDNGKVEIDKILSFDFVKGAEPDSEIINWMKENYTPEDMMYSVKEVENKFKNKK